MPEPTDYTQKMIKEQESIRKMYEPSEYVQRMLKEYESNQKMFEPSEHVKKMLEEQESFRRMYEPPEYVKIMLEGQETFREMFSPRGVAATTLQSLLNQGGFDPLDITERIKNLSKELPVSEFYINSDGSLSFEEQNINVSELSISISTFFEEISEECSIEIILDRLACLKKPVQSIAIWILDKIIVAFIVSVMAGLYTTNLQKILDSSSLKSKREVTQSIKNLSHEIDLNEYKGYRVITTDNLNLLQNPHMKSRVIAKLKRGKLVRVLQKKKNWTKVETESSDSCGKIVGWVTTRYIVPLNR